MKKAWLLLGGVAVASLVSANVWAQAKPPAPRAFAQWDKIQMSVTDKLAPNLYILHGSPVFDTSHPDGAGGRIAVLWGPDGVLMVDSEDEELHDKVLQAIRTFTKAPIRILVNSHIHPDHTGGDPFFAKQGAVIFSSENLRDEMLHPPPRANGQPAPAPDPAGVPVVTYKLGQLGVPAMTIHMNGETVDFIPTPPAHTGGDTIVRFNKANVIYIEDFYRNFGYPFADQANGGSIRGMIQVIDLLEKIAKPDTRLVPGHGTLVTKKDLLPYRAMLVDLLAKVKGMVDHGKSLKDVLAANLTAPYDTTTKGDSQSSKDRFITEVYYEVKGLPPIVNGVRDMRNMH